MYSTCIHARVYMYRYIYVLLLTILTVYTMMLHLWDTGSEGAPIDNQNG